MYVITGATGNVGSKVSQLLLAKGEKVRVLGRNGERLQPLVELGAESRIGDLEDLSFLSKAFDGASAVFAVIPPNVRVDDMRSWQNRIGSSIACALENAQVKHVVNLSSLGAHLSEKTGPVLGLRDQELRLNTNKQLNILHLRPAFFMENLYMNADSIMNKSVINSVLDGDAKFPTIATSDIAQVATEKLLTADSSDKKTFELLGQRDLTMNEIAKIISHELDDPKLKYAKVSHEDAVNHLIQLGVSKHTAQEYAELEQSMSDGLISVEEGRTDENTTKTSFEEFAKEFVKNIKSM